MREPDESTLTLRELGERGVLQRILPLLPGSAGLIVGPGDDSAVVELSSTQVVTSCDMMVEEHVGHKAMTSNLADIAAMGARPIGVIVALAAPPDTPVRLVAGIARGIAQGLERLAPGVGVLGGDLSTSSALTLSVTVIGDMEGRSPVLRSGAKPGDIVAVSGQPGQSERGFRLLEQATLDDGGVLSAARRNQLVSHPDVAHHLAPLTDLDLGPQAADAGAHALMDVSDGLALDATRLAEASSVIIDFTQHAVVDEAWLVGGEDHGFLATFPPDTTIPQGFVSVGVVRPLDGDGPRALVGGAPITAPTMGWDPYRDSVSTQVSP